MQNNTDKKNDSFRESIRLTAGHYDPQAYNSRKAITGMPFAIKRLRFRAVAASVAAALLAAAAVVAVMEFRDVPTPAPIEKSVPAPPEKTPTKVKRLEFSDAPVSSVAREIENVYGVTLANLPADDQKLTLSYTGTAADLVETINAMLGCDIRIITDSEKN